MRGPSKKPKTFITCINCGKIKRTFPCHIRKGGGKFCSKKCANVYNAKRGEDNPTWKGGLKDIPCDICGEVTKRYPSWIEPRNFCSRECFSKGMKGYFLGDKNPGWNSKEVQCSTCGLKFYAPKGRIENTKNLFCSRKCQGEWASKHRRGENATHWQGGITDPYMQIRNCDKYKNWKELVFKRDVNTCQKCGSIYKIEAHHIISFKKIVKGIIEATTKKTFFKEALNNAILWDINNGQTLCSKCHRREKKDVTK